MMKNGFMIMMLRKCKHTISQLYSMIDSFLKIGIDEEDWQRVEIMHACS